MATAFTQAALDAASREEDAAIAKKQELLRARRVTENYIYDGRRSLAQIQSRIAEWTKELSDLDKALAAQ